MSSPLSVYVNLFIIVYIYESELKKKKNLILKKIGELEAQNSSLSYSYFLRQYQLYPIASKHIKSVLYLKKNQI